MKKIYLASGSKARKKLLEMFGLKFEVLPSGIKESFELKGLSYEKLVKNNALAKAASVAGRIKSGVVIGADTIAVQGKKICGKPKDLKHARAMLRQLSNKPQWIYTGIAVIDKGAAYSKALVTCERSKVFMDKISNSEIDDYFKKVSPLDKAGSFDIQGRGAFFIRRIEGCFYNVVGLPLNKLYRVFKEMGLLFFICGLFLPGCATEYNIATKQEEAYYYSTDKEVRMGAIIARELEKEDKLADDPLLKKRVEDVGNKVAAVSDRKEIDYHFNVLDDEEVNAVSLPGGFVYINKGLLEKVDNDDQLAGIIGHEIGHIVARHSIKKLQALQGYSFLRILIAVTPGTAQAGSAADMAFAELLCGYGREDELLADRLGTRYARLAGYNPRAMLDFLKKMQEINRKKPLRPKSYFKTHPYVPDRIRVVKEELGEKMNFNDYINIEDTDEGR
jgi:MAF protein